MKAKVAIIGSGNIGWAIRKLLKESDCIIYNLDKMGYASDLTSIDNVLINLNIKKDTRHKLLKIDLCNYSKTLSAVKYANPDLIMHLAAESHVDNSIKGPDEFIKSNILGTFNLLECTRNYLNSDTNISAEELLIDKAQLMRLTAPEMTVLVGGMRVLNANYDGSDNGVFTKKPGSLSNDYFKNLLDMNTTWKEVDKKEQLFVGKDRNTNKVKWKGTRVDLIFGSNSQLRAIAEVYACEDGEKKFISDFVAAWAKVMNSDRFDLKLN